MARQTKSVLRRLKQNNAAFSDGLIINPTALPLMNANPYPNPANRDAAAPKSRAHTAAVAALCLLIAVSLAWELWLAPLRPGGSWLALKALPLCLPLAGILKGRVYTFQYSSLLVLPYFAEAVVRLFDAAAASRACAAAALVCSTVFFIACLAYVKQQKKAVRHG